MTNKLRAAAELALEACETALRHFTKTPSTLADSTARGNAHAAITALRTALAEQPAEQEPYCYTYTENGEEYFAPPTAYVPDHAKPLYTAPQPAKRKPLTREHVRASGGIVHSDGNVFFTSLEHLNSAVEAAHGITGETK